MWGLQLVSTLFVQALKIVLDSWKFSMLLLYILWDDWPIFMISVSNEQLLQQLEYNLLKPDWHSWWISKMQSGREVTLEERYAIKLCFKLGKKMPQKRIECLRLLLDNLAWISQTQEGQTEQIYLQTLDDPFLLHWHDLHVMGSHWTDSQQGILFCGFKGVQEDISVGRGQHSSNRVSGISTRTMHQSTTPSLSQTIWPRWATRQFLTLPIVETLIPVTFGYSQGKP